MKKVMPVLEGWPPPIVSRTTRALEWGGIRSWTRCQLRYSSHSDMSARGPSLMSRLCSSNCHVRVRELLGHLDHSDIRKVVIPCIRNRLASAGGLGWSDHRESTTALNRLGSYDEAHWAAD